MIYFDSKFFLQLVAISWTPWFWSNSSEFEMEFWSECCFIVDSNQRQQMSVKNIEAWKNIRSKWSLLRLVCARIGLWSGALENASDQTVPDQSDLWSDRPRPKWPLIRQVPDHCPDKSAFEAFSRPCNSNAPSTYRIRAQFGLATSTWAYKDMLKFKWWYFFDSPGLAEGGSEFCSKSEDLCTKNCIFAFVLIFLWIFFWLF